jgi:hypothetical protein
MSRCGLLQINVTRVRGLYCQPAMGVTLPHNKARTEHDIDAMAR